MLSLTSHILRDWGKLLKAPKIIMIRWLTLSARVMHVRTYGKASRSRTIIVKSENIMEVYEKKKALKDLGAYRPAFMMMHLSFPFSSSKLALYNLFL